MITNRGADAVPVGPHLFVVTQSRSVPLSATADDRRTLSGEVLWNELWNDLKNAA